MTWVRDVALIMLCFDYRLEAAGTKDERCITPRRGLWSLIQELPSPQRSKEWFSKYFRDATFDRVSFGEVVLILVLCGDQG